jgi:hypothetical protein
MSTIDGETMSPANRFSERLRERRRCPSAGAPDGVETVATTI